MSLDLIGDGLAPDDARSLLVQRAMSGTGRMQSLIDDLLAYARVGAELQRVPVDLAAVLTDVREDLAAPLGGRHGRGGGAADGHR